MGCYELPDHIPEDCGKPQGGWNCRHANYFSPLHKFLPTQTLMLMDVSKKLNYGKYIPFQLQELPIIQVCLS